MASERGYGESLLTGYASDQSLADAVAEADIYVAYGRHQHALDTLEVASAAEPDNATGLLKMLDIYLSLDRVDEATELLLLIEATNATGALDAARSRIQAHATPLEGDAGGRELAGETTDDSHESTVTMDMSLDLEFQRPRLHSRNWVLAVLRRRATPMILLKPLLNWRWRILIWVTKSAHRIYFKPRCRLVMLHSVNVRSPYWKASSKSRWC